MPFGGNIGFAEVLIRLPLSRLFKLLTIPPSKPELIDDALA